jgi:hypothetical protein
LIRGSQQRTQSLQGEGTVNTKALRHDWKAHIPDSKTWESSFWAAELGMGW